MSGQSANIFSDSDFLSRRPVIAITLIILGLLLFGAFAYNLVAKGPLLPLDNRIANTLPADVTNSPAYVLTTMDAGFIIGQYVLIALAVFVGLYLIKKRSWQEFTMLIVGLIGESLLFFILTNYFGRHRPPTQIGIQITVPGFPSGHAMASLVFYGLMAYLLIPNIRSIFWKVVVAAAAILIIVFVGLTRVFTAGHYLTDVLAGYSLAIAWSSLIFTLIELLFRKRRRKNG